MLTPDAISLNPLQTEGAYTYDQLAKRKTLAPGVWVALDRPDLDQKHDYLFAGFMPSLDALHRLGRRGSTLDPSLSLLPTITFSNWIATNSNGCHTVHCGATSCQSFQSHVSMTSE